jgi:hypothetical protein
MVVSIEPGHCPDGNGAIVISKDNEVITNTHPLFLDNKTLR